jgi:hypothetical protein
LPVKRGKIDESKDDQNLDCDKGILREGPEKVGAFVKYGDQKNEKECCCNSDNLAGPAHGEIPHDRLRVFFLHLLKFLLHKKCPREVAHEVHDYRAKTFGESSRIYRCRQIPVHIPPKE